MRATVDREDGATRGGRARLKAIGACGHAARHAVKARSEIGHIMWRGELGADGPARRSSSVSRGVVDGATANSLAADRHGPRQDDQAVKTKPLTAELLADSGSGPGANASPLLQGTGRLNRSARWLGWLKGGLDIPATYAECRSLQREHPLRTLTRRAWSRAGRIGNAQFASHRSLLCEDALPVVPQPIEQDPGHSAVPFRDGRPFS